MFWRRSPHDEAVAAIQQGAVIYTALYSLDRVSLDEYMELTAEDFRCLRLYIKAERDETVLDCVWKTVDGVETYYVRRDWDISEITSLES